MSYNGSGAAPDPDRMEVDGGPQGAGPVEVGPMEVGAYPQGMGAQEVQGGQQGGFFNILFFRKYTFPFSYEQIFLFRIKMHHVTT